MEELATSMIIKKLSRSNKGSLIVFGCSWAAGEWLPGWEQSPYVFSKYSWPALLGQALNIEVWNMAGGGNSNREILHNILQFDKNIGFHPDDLVIVCWSFYNREVILGWEFEGQQIRTMELLFWGVGDRKPDGQFYTVHPYVDLEIKSREYVHHAECFFKSKNIKYKMGTIQPWEDRNENWLIYNDEDLLLFEQIDYAEDNAHPGVESNKKFFEKLLEEING